MLKHLELSTEHSCLNKAEDNEPLFVLLGRDESSVAAINAWISHRVSSGKNNYSDPKIVEAAMLCEEMMAFREKREARKNVDAGEASE